MGQQQLLLIVLGVIIVGIAVVVGINVFTASSVEANKSAVVADLTTLASMGQQFYRKPIALGGGGNAFDNWEIPTSLQSTANGSYEATTAAGNSLVLVGTGTELDGTDSVKVTMTIDPQKIASTVFGTN